MAAAKKAAKPVPVSGKPPVKVAKKATKAVRAPKDQYPT